MIKTLLAALALALAPAAAAFAHAYDAGDLHIGHPWTRPTPNAAPTAVGYLTVTNHGRVTERLLGGSSPAAKSLEPHTMSMAGGVMRMRLLSGGYAIAPGQTLTLAPGGNHLMFIAPSHPFTLGQRIPATLRFSHAGAVKVDFVVQDAAPSKGMARVSAPH